MTDKLQPISYQGAVTLLGFIAAGDRVTILPWPPGRMKYPVFLPTSKGAAEIHHKNGATLTALHVWESPTLMQLLHAGTLALSITAEQAKAMFPPTANVEYLFSILNFVGRLAKSHPLEVQATVDASSCINAGTFLSDKSHWNTLLRGATVLTIPWQTGSGVVPILKECDPTVIVRVRPCRSSGVTLRNKEKRTVIINEEKCCQIKELLDTPYLLHAISQCWLKVSPLTWQFAFYERQQSVQPPSKAEPAAPSVRQATVATPSVSLPDPQVLSTVPMIRIDTEDEEEYTPVKLNFDPP